jgi:hypothetical protein
MRDPQTKAECELPASRCSESFDEWDAKYFSVNQFPPPTNKRILAFDLCWHDAELAEYADGLAWESHTHPDLSARKEFKPTHWAHHPGFPNKGIQPRRRRWLR